MEHLTKVKYTSRGATLASNPKVRRKAKMELQPSTSVRDTKSLTPLTRESRGKSSAVVNIRGYTKRDVQKNKHFGSIVEDKIEKIVVPKRGSLGKEVLLLCG